jgi:predicted nucleic acid-binding protein
MPSRLYLDTSASLRVVLERGTAPEVERKIRSAVTWITSRLATVESARAFYRLRQTGERSEAQLADAQRALSAIWARCEMWELTPAVCETARQVAPGTHLRTLDALHLATFVLARQRIENLELLTTDRRLQEAAAIT